MKAAATLRLIALALLLPLVLAGAVYSLWNLSRATTWVQHTQEVRRALLRLVSLMVDAETAQRGYLVDGDREFLGPYDRATTTWRQEFERLVDLTQDNQRQHQRVEELESMIQTKLEELRDTMAARDAGVRGVDLDARMVRGKRMMDAIRHAADEIDQEEQRLGHERERAARSRWGWTMFLFLGGAFVFVIVVGAAWMQRRKEEARRLLAEQHERRFAEQFMGILGHDLRNPLNAIALTAGLQKRKGDADTKAFDRILSSAQRMSNMVAQLLDLTRSRLAGGIPIERKPIDLSVVVSGIVDELRAAYPGRVIRWEVPGEVRGAWDADRLAQVASNLISNAVEHGDPATPVEVELALSGDSAMFTVRNSGAPIPSELLPALFDPYRSGAAREGKANGLGLGLFITQQIVLAHGGRIEVHSSPEQGTRFVVALPRHVTDELSPTEGHPVH